MRTPGDPQGAKGCCSLSTELKPLPLVPVYVVMNCASLSQGAHSLEGIHVHIFSAKYMLAFKLDLSHFPSGFMATMQSIPGHRFKPQSQ